jgi:crotonobetainyl-CoA:carnitine CoA-transferase CaiB-like acyl-CoA transferase
MSADSKLPLDGIRVVEFSHMVMGPTCGLPARGPRRGSDQGGARRARAIRRGTSRAPGRILRLVQPQQEERVARSRHRQGQALAQKLIATADVFLENFRPGALESKGLGYEALAKANPRLIYCSLKGFLHGPYETRTALDEVVQMMSGLAYMTGPVGQPLRAGAPVNDMMGGMFGAIAILAALRNRDRTGRGEYVQSGLFENAAWLVSTHMMQHAVSGKEPEPMSAGKRAWGVYDVFESADGVRIFIGVVTERQWEIFTGALGEAELADPAYATNNQRSAARSTLIPLVAKLLRKHPIVQLERICEEGGLPFARIQTPSALFDDPHLNAGGMIPLTLPDGAKTRIPALPILFGDERLPLRSGLPAPGQHNHEILGDLE